MIMIMAIKKNPDYDYMCLIMIIMHRISHIAIQPVSLHSNWLIAPNKH